MVSNGFNIIITFYINTVSNSCYIINIGIVYLPAIYKIYVLLYALACLSKGNYAYTLIQ